MRSFIKRKRVLVSVGAVVLLVAAGGAYAYFTTPGSGTGSGSVGTSTAVVLHGSVTNPLYPGTSSPVTFTVDNPSTGVQRVTTIHLVSVVPDAGHSSCVAGDFTMGDVTVGESVAAGSGHALTATGTLVMADSGSNQDACKNATLTLNLTSV